MKPVIFTPRKPPIFDVKINNSNGLSNKPSPVNGPQRGWLWTSVSQRLGRRLEVADYETTQVQKHVEPLLTDVLRRAREGDPAKGEQIVLKFGETLKATVGNLINLTDVPRVYRPAVAKQVQAGVEKEGLKVIWQNDKGMAVASPEALRAFFERPDVRARQSDLRSEAWKSNLAFIGLTTALVVPAPIYVPIAVRELREQLKFISTGAGMYDGTAGLSKREHTFDDLKV